jgi:hypothetical protein
VKAEASAEGVHGLRAAFKAASRNSDLIRSRLGTASAALRAGANGGNGAANKIAPTE